MSRRGKGEGHLTTPHDAQREVITHDDPDASLCTVDGTEHDYRPHTYESMGRSHTSLRCVWCHAVACGDYGEDDPCIEPYHHDVRHRTKAGVTWPKGGDRPAWPCVSAKD